MPESTSKENTKHTRVLKPEDIVDLLFLWREIVLSKVDIFFHPHAFNINQATKICNYNGKDLYIGCFVGNTLAAYGLLRGWDDGYDIPSLGIYVSEKFRGTGLSKYFMNELHELAKDNGSKSIRLTVLKDNVKAISLYKGMGYSFDEKDSETFLGTKELF